MNPYRLFASKPFLKSLNKRRKSGFFNEEKLEHIIHMLSHREGLPYHCKDHSLRANWNGFRECHIQPDLLLVYKIENDTLILSYLGSHSELFE